MQIILEEACQTLGENMVLVAREYYCTYDMRTIKDFTSPLGFLSNFQDLNIYGGDQLDLKTELGEA